MKIHCTYSRLIMKNSKYSNVLIDAQPFTVLFNSSRYLSILVKANSLDIYLDLSFEVKAKSEKPLKSSDLQIVAVCFSLKTWTAQNQKSYKLHKLHKLEQMKDENDESILISYIKWSSKEVPIINESIHLLLLASKRQSEYQKLVLCQFLRTHRQPARKDACKMEINKITQWKYSYYQLLWA